MNFIKYIIVLICLTGIHFSSLACDVCGCSVGGNYLGILPQFQQHFVGIRYQYQSFTSEHPPLFGEEKGLLSEEYFHTVEVWGRFYPHPRIQIFAFVPYHSYQKTEEELTMKNSGLGDISLMANYVVLNSGDSMFASVKHALQLGGGIKLPTGRNDLAEEGQQPIANLQPGTGSVDFLANAIYTVRYKKLGLNTEASYRFNTVSDRDYKFGDRFSAATRLFYWLNAVSVTFLPQAGVQYEYALKDYIHYHNREFQDLSGGSRYFANAGLDIYFKNFSTGINWSTPIHQSFAEGNINSQNQLSLNLIYMF